MKKKSLITIKSFTRTQLVEQQMLSTFKGGCGNIIFSNVDPWGTTTVGSTYVFPRDSDETNDPDNETDHDCFYVLE